MFVAAVGFFTDAYDIFALNVISQILPYVYGDGSGQLPQHLQAALLVSTLAGTMVGQIVFGWAGDRYGRRKMYGLELIVLIVGSIGTAMSSEGRGNFLLHRIYCLTYGSINRKYEYLGLACHVESHHGRWYRS